MEVWLHTLWNMDPYGGGQVHWPCHLISPQGWKSPEYVGGGGGVAGACVNAMEKSKLCSCKERNQVPWLFSPWPTHSLYWLSHHLDFILDYCIWMLIKTFTVYSQDHMTSESCHVFCCWNCDRAEHCMMYSRKEYLTLSSGGTVVCMKHTILFVPQT